MPDFIAPTIGRVVLYSPSDQDSAIIRYSEKPCTALVVYVWSDSCINLTVFDHGGTMHERSSVPINNVAGASAWAEWMPYQVGQAKKAAADVPAIGPNT